MCLSQQAVQQQQPAAGVVGSSRGDSPLLMHIYKGVKVVQRLGPMGSSRLKGGRTRRISGAASSLDWQVDSPRPSRTSSPRSLCLIVGDVQQEGVGKAGSVLHLHNRLWT